jgi:hypothetical protein
MGNGYGDESSKLPYGSTKTNPLFFYHQSTYHRFTVSLLFL